MAIYCDRRLGGVAKFVLTTQPKKLMDIPPDILKCVAFLVREENGEQIPGGTAFFVAKESPNTGQKHLFAVTARHCVEKFDDFEDVYLRINLKTGKSDTVSTHKRDWTFHSDQSVDMAVCRFELRNEFDHLALLATQDFFSSKHIRQGSEVFITGLFLHHAGMKKNIPIIRIGNVAALREERVWTKPDVSVDVYLVEVRSLGGLSGSPVFECYEYETDRPVSAMHGRINRPIEISQISKNPAYRLIGLIHGHWDTPILRFPGKFYGEEINTGISMVVPVEKIIEAINQPIILEEDQKLESDFRNRGLPTED